MIRRDYILRMIEEFIRSLAKVHEQKHQGRWREADASLEEQAKRLTGVDLASICILTDTELLAALLKSGEFHAQGEKSFMLARVLMEAADVASAEDRESTGSALRMKALHLLLHAALRGEVFEWPQFVPSIDLLLQSFDRMELPVHTQALLMQHFERTGQFAKAEDALHMMLEFMPDNPTLQQLAISFYQRLLTQSDTALAVGDLTRTEVELALEESRERAARE